MVYSAKYPTINGMKVCSECLVEQPEENFRWTHSETSHKRHKASKCKSCQRARRMSEEGKKIRRDRRLLRTYGISLQDYDQLFLKQKGVCAICKKPPKESRFLVVDHDHKTGKVRGLLCDGCNVFLTLVDGRRDLLEASLNYIAERS